MNDCNGNVPALPGIRSSVLFGTFGVIYADPPWTYEQKGLQGAAAKQYPLMTDDELCAMQIPAAKDCVLYMWATSPLLESGLRVMQAWGFRYKSQAVWNKKRPGIGFWWLGQHEILMVGVRGNVKPPPPHLRKSSVILCGRGRHSAKPEQVRQWIEQWYPDVPKLEMFSRLKRPGWEVFGNQIEHDLLSGATYGTNDRTERRDGPPLASANTKNVNGPSRSLQ